MISNNPVFAICHAPLCSCAIAFSVTLQSRRELVGRYCWGEVLRVRGEYTSKGKASGFVYLLHWLPICKSVVSTLLFVVVLQFSVLWIF